MAVRLDINANVRGTGRVRALDRGVKGLGRSTQVAAVRMAGLETAAIRGRASLAALATTLRFAVLGSLAAVTVGIAKFTSATFATGNLLEGLGVRFELLFGSVEEGGKAFDALATFAAKVPFSLADIAAGSGNLAVVSKDADELAKLLAVTGNVAAATGLDFRQTAEQIQRAFAGGIAAADVFRERGVRAMLGFESGVTVSIAETVARFDEVFGPGGKFGQATGLLAETLQGQFSLVDDAFFTFRRNIADTFFTGLTAQIRGVVGELNENGAELERLARNIGSGISRAFVSLEGFGRTVIANFGAIIAGIKAIIAFKLTGIIAGITAAFIQWGVVLVTTAARVGILNAVMRANPIGLVITAIQLLVAGFIFFREEINGATKAALEFVSAQFTKLQDTVIKFVRILNVIPGVNLKLETSYEKQSRVFEEQVATAIKLRNVHSEINDAIKIQSKELESARNLALGNVSFEVGDNIQTDGALEALRIENELASVVTGIANRNFQNQVSLGLRAFEASSRSVREFFESIDITSQLIGNTISDTWIEGLREGQRAGEILNNTLRNVLQTIADTVLRNSINLLVEKGFEALGRKKLDNQKQLNAEKLKELGISKALQAANFFGGSSSSSGGGILKSITSFLGFNQGGIVPGGAPYTDRIPALLTPGERVIPRNEVNNNNSNSNTVTNNTINISGNVDQRSIDQIRNVIASSAGEVGGANKDYNRNTAGLKSRRR